MPLEDFPVLTVKRSGMFIKAVELDGEPLLSARSVTVEFSPSDTFLVTIDLICSDVKIEEADAIHD